MKGLIGKKVGMTQVFTEEGNVVPVTVIDVSSCVVVDKRTPEKDKYSAVTLGFEEVKEKALNKPLLGLFKKKGITPRRHLKEFRLSADEASGLNPGDAVGADLFEKGQLIDITGVTKGRGFQGVVRKFKFAGHIQTHGTHETRRHPGSIGQRKTPGRVFPGKKLPGHMGVKQRTTQNLVVVDVDAEKNLVLVRGAVPGHTDGIVYLRPSNKKAARDRHAAAKS